MTTPQPPEPPATQAAPEPTPEPPDPTPETLEPTLERPPASDPGWTDGLRGPRGCAEWTVVILGVIWVVLAVIFVIALVVRLNG